jgi:hypothetical protein
MSARAAATVEQSAPYSCLRSIVGVALALPFKLSQVENSGWLMALPFHFKAPLRVTRTTSTTGSVTNGRYAQCRSLLMQNSCSDRQAPKATMAARTIIVLWGAGRTNGSIWALSLKMGMTAIGPKQTVARLKKTIVAQRTVT